MSGLSSIGAPGAYWVRLVFSRPIKNLKQKHRFSVAHNKQTEKKLLVIMLPFKDSPFDFYIDKTLK